VLYSPVTEALAAAGIVPHYAANITGHGWRKLMRHPSTLTYRLDAVPERTPVLDFAQRECGLDDHEAYGTLNMGAGCALCLDPADATRAVEIANGLGVRALVAGRVEAGPRGVVIEPLGVEFAGDELQLR
jgi:phosphoribosylformylglycinamidine cyclo-ligase